jgi:type I restriction enzyme S subunit
MIDAAPFPLADKADVIRGVTFSKGDAVSQPRDGYTPVLRAGNIQGHLILDDDLVYVPERMVSDKQRLRRGDILMCTSSGSAEIVGKTGFTDRDWNGSFGAFCAVVRPKVGKCHPRYLFHYLQSPKFRDWTRNSSGVGIKNIRKSELDAVEIPFPLPDEQRRIAAILDKADAIRRKREQALTLADDFLRSVFLEMFGDPVTNPLGFSQRSLGSCSRFTSGATPSKANPSFWVGEFPWVSPKDMKVDTIWDAEDHVSDLAFEQTNLKKIDSGTPLIVVRGMILVHTVPIAMTARDVAINQDMKAILFDEDIDPLFGFWCLKVQHEHILGKVDTAAHGTKRLDTDRLGEVMITVPDDDEQQRFLTIVRKFNKSKDVMTAAAAGSVNLFAALSQRAFAGDL